MIATIAATAIAAIAVKMCTSAVMPWLTAVWFSTFMTGPFVAEAVTVILPVVPVQALQDQQDQQQ